MKVVDRGLILFDHHMAKDKHQKINVGGKKVKPSTLAIDKQHSVMILGDQLLLAHSTSSE